MYGIFQNGFEVEDEACEREYVPRRASFLLGNDLLGCEG